MNNGLARPAALLARRAALGTEQAGDRTEMQRRLPRLAMLPWPDQQRAKTSRHDRASREGVLLYGNTVWAFAETAHRCHNF